MKGSVYESLNSDIWADIEQMRQPKPMPPAEKKKTVTRYADMTPEKRSISGSRKEVDEREPRGNARLLEALP